MIKIDIIPVIAVDLDDCVFENFIETILELYNKKYDDNLSLDKITDYNIRLFLKPECKDIFKEFIDANFFKQMNISRDAIRFLTWANKYGELIFITAGCPYTMEFRHQALAMKLPFYSAKQLWRGENKKLLKCDYLIDDCMENLKCNLATTICMSRPWNTDGHSDYRVDNFAQVKQIILDQEEKFGNDF